MREPIRQCQQTIGLVYSPHRSDAPLMAAVRVAVSYWRTMSLWRSAVR